MSQRTLDYALILSIACFAYTSSYVFAYPYLCNSRLQGKRVSDGHADVR